MPPPDTLDARIARAMARQHHVLHRDQLVRLGLSPRAISHRAAAGRLFRVAPKVYALAPVTTRESWWTEAVLACGPGSVLSHESASALYGGDRLLRRHAVPGAGVHVTTARRAAARGLVIAHRRDALDARDVTTHRGIPVTSVERVLVDLGASRTEHQLADHLHELTYRYDVDVGYLGALAARRRGTWHHAESVLGALALVASGVRGTHSELEDLFLRVLQEEGIRLPATNVRARIAGGTYRLDAVWRDARLVVELDGRRSHGRPRNVVDDARRDAALASEGLRVRRLRWIDLTTRRAATVAWLRAALGSG